MSTDLYAPPTPPSAPTAGPSGASLGQLYTGAKGARDGGWDKIRTLIKNGRRITREERLRWQENREFYRGNQTVFLAPGEQHLRGSVQGAQNGRVTANAYNRLRQFTDGRVALLTKERPPYMVEPEDRDQDSIDAARQGEKFVAARWGNAGWKIRPRTSELYKNAEIDGIAWLSVLWDPEASESADELIAVDAQTGQPIADRATYEAMKAEDPAGTTLWRMERSTKPLGDVCWRVVLPNAMSVDPFAVKNHGDAKWLCESRVRPRYEVEARLGMTFKDAVRASSTAMGERVTDIQYEDLAIDEGAGATTGKVNESDGVVVHYFYAKPCHEFPKGVHLEFCDKAPGKPLLVEPWQDELPYFCLVPRPDPGNFIRSKGIVDDLKPIQRDYNSTLRDLREWLKRAARTPVALPFGSMASDSYFNEDGVFFYHPAMGEPHHSMVPSEPVAVITNDLNRMVAEMRDISGISAATQGLTAPGAPDAAVGLNIVLQQTENNLAEAESGLAEAIEWGVSRSLQLVEKHYSAPRAVAGVGVDDAEEFSAFQGAMLRGAHRFRITGSLMPRSKAARIATIMQMLPFLGEKVMPFFATLLDGDPTEIQRDFEIDRQNEKGAIRELMGLAGDEKANIVYRNFEEEKQAFSKALNIAIASGAPNPMAVLAQQAPPVLPPNLTQSLQQAGFDLPLVEDFTNYALALKALDEFRKSDGYRRIHPMSKQLLRERAQEHKRGLNQQVQAMAQQMPIDQQQGSAPRQPGQPSPPKYATQPGGMG